MGEFAINPFYDTIMDSDVVERFTLQRLGYELTREAIIGWLLKVIPVDI